MPKNSEVSLVNRRVFLGMGMIALVLADIGCGEGGVTQVTDPPTVKGTRWRLDAMKKNAGQTPAKKKK
jgi:hypothetical protein